MNTSTLTISPVQQEDEDEYYCVASNEYSDISHRAMVTIYGKATILCTLTVYNQKTHNSDHKTKKKVQYTQPLTKFSIHICSTPLKFANAVAKPS